MKVRVVGAAVVMVALAGLAGCGSSKPSASPDGSTPAAAVDVDVQAAKACKTMEDVLKSTNNGETTMSGEEAKDFQTSAGALIRTPDGKTPTTADEVPTWYELGTAQVSLYVAVASQVPEDIKTYTDQARVLCLTIPEAAQKKASYTPVPTTPS